MFLENVSQLLYCAASFKYPSLSRGGVKRPDGELIFPSALADKHYGLTALSSREHSTIQIERNIKFHLNKPGGGALPQPLLLGLLGLGPVLVHQLEQLGGWRRETGVRFGRSQQFS